MSNALFGKIFFKRVLQCAAVGALSVISLNSYAGGFQLFESSAKSLGNAFSGTSAIAQDASTEYYNPAGMTLLDHPEISITGTCEFYYIKFT